MYTTSVSLLERLRQPAAQDAWSRFVKLYTPLVYSWARRAGLSSDDAVDLVQDVFAQLVKKLPDFAYNRSQSFRGWLRTVTLNKWRENARRRGLPVCAPGDGSLSQLSSPDNVEAFGEAEYRQYVVHRALELMKAEFEQTTWRACWESVVSERSASDVAAELGISVNAVYLAKSRVLRRLHQELEGLLE
jgi:RNA polymerase sigma-70 factor (ECF subfamily)